MENLLEAYRHYLISHAEFHQYRITDLVIGTSFTLLSLNNQWWGLALTLSKGCPCDEHDDLHFLQHSRQLSIPWVLENMHKLTYGNSIVGALVNALFHQWVVQHPERVQYVDPTELFLPGPKKIVLFGYFKHHVHLFEKQKLDWYVVEKKLDIIPPEHISRALAFDEDTWKEVIQKSELNLITGSSVINETVGMIFKHVSPFSINVLTGPSAGGIIEVLQSYPVHGIATSIVIDPDLLKTLIMLGSSARNLFQLKALQKVCVLIK